MPAIQGIRRAQLLWAGISRFAVTGEYAAWKVPPRSKAYRENMTIPVWVLLLFAAWTVVLLSGTVGYFRWSRILTGRATIREWRPDEDQGTDWYRRAMRAHANCLENLPLYTVVVIALQVTHASSPWLDVLAVILLAARIAQSILHIGPKQTELVAGARFGCYAIQVVCMVIMGAWAALAVS